MRRLPGFTLGNRPNSRAANGELMGRCRIEHDDGCALPCSGERGAHPIGRNWPGIGIPAAHGINRAEHRQRRATVWAGDRHDGQFLGFIDREPLGRFTEVAGLGHQWDEQAGTAQRVDDRCNRTRSRVECRLSRGQLGRCGTVVTGVRIWFERSPGPRLSGRVGRIGCAEHVLAH